MGSYADLYFGKYGIKSWKVEDIYVPDGQLQGHIDPPTPIQEAFKTGDYRLRNANWKINFPDAASEIIWFFDKGGVKNIDGIVALNLSFVEKLLEIIGPVKPLDYPEEINSSNFYKIAQGYSETNFFPGSTKKGNYLYGLGKVVFQKTMDSPLSQKLKVVNLIRHEFDNREMYLFMKDPKLESKVANLGWDGSLGTYKVDYFYPVESNLGANKVNYYVTRDTKRQATTLDNEFAITTDIDWKNTYAGDWDYVNYERIVIPSTSELQTLRLNGKDINFDKENEGQFLIIGFWAKVPHASSANLNLVYSLPRNGKETYQVVTRKQPGL